MGLSNLQLHLANLRAAACFFSHYARASLNNTSAGLYILSRHPPRCITCEKRSHVGDVFWRAHAIEGRQTCAESAVLLRQHVHIGESRRDNVHRNVARTEFDRQGAGKLLDSPFASEIKRVVGEMHLRAALRYDDNATTVAHVACSLLQREKHALGVGV